MITDAIRKATDQYGSPRMMPDCIRELTRRPVRECVIWALNIAQLRILALVDITGVQHSDVTTAPRADVAFSLFLVSVNL